MTNAMLSNHLLIILFSVGILSFICKTKVRGGQCEQGCPCYRIECGENAICDNDECVCEPGFFDFPPMTVADSDGCLGECNELGMTSQCGGNRECTLTPQGFGVCACPADTFGPPHCLDDCESNLQCSLRGNCENGKCVCLSGFQGKNCEESLTTPESVTKKPLKKLPLLIGALTFPLLLLVPAGLVSAIKSGK